MAASSDTRRLAAVLAADVVGFSRLMREDEAGTHRALKRHRQTVFDPAVAANRGRIVKLMGDGTLVEFASVVDAMNCAIAVQQGADPAGDDGPPITLRISIHIGDVIIDGDDIYGDGVNIAVRLEALAQPGGVCVSSIVAKGIGTRSGITFADGGTVSVKNIDQPIRIWKWHPQESAEPGALPEARREQASIAVLAFDNLSGGSCDPGGATGDQSQVLLCRACRPPALAGSGPGAVEGRLCEGGDRRLKTAVSARAPAARAPRRERRSEPPSPGARSR